MFALNFHHVLMLCGFAVMLAGGQILFKMSAGQVPTLTSMNGLFSLALNPWFWAALVLYGFATLLWIFILQMIPLSVAYPFMALGFILVPAASRFLFDEPINLYYIAGAGLIICGIILAGFAGRLG